MSLKKLSAQFEKYIPKGVVNATANVLSAPAVIKSGLKQRKNKIATLRLKDAQKFKGMPDFDDEGNVTEGFKARSLANEVKVKMNKPKSNFKEMYKKATSNPNIRPHRR